MTLETEALLQALEQQARPLLQQLARGEDVSPAECYRFEGWCEALQSVTGLESNIIVQRLSALATGILGPETGEAYAELAQPMILPLQREAPVYPST